MIIEKTSIDGAFIIKRQPFTDERGYFTRMFCKNELGQAGIHADFVQSNLSMNKEAKTLRGLHSQKDEYAEEKLVSCTRGKIFDVCVDVRKNSKTFGQYVSAELTEENGVMLYIPKGCAHGYLTLEKNAQVLYFVTQFYEPGSEVGFRYDDPAFQIDWPIKSGLILSEKDKNWAYI